MTSFILLAPIFWAGYFLSGPFFWLPWAGLARLCFLYQARRRGHFAKDFLLPCWGVSLAVYAVCFYWIYAYEGWAYVFAVLAFSVLFPLFFLLHHLLTSRIRSQTVEIAAAFGVFFIFEIFLSWSPAMESLGLDLFFQPPAAVLCVLKFISFKVWSAWVFAACFAAGGWIHEKRLKCFLLLGALVGGMAVLVIFAHVQNKSSANATERKVKIALVQHNLPYSEVWWNDHPDEIKEKYRELALKAALGGPDLIVFPLYDLPGDVYREPAFLEDLAKTAKCPILVASHVPIKAGDKDLDLGFMNLALLYDSAGKVKDIYQAVDVLPFLDQYMERAKKYRVMRGPFGKLGVLLCYEDSIPRLSREAARGGAGVLLALSNPELFQKTAILYYQLCQDQIRAAETGLPLIRVSPNGYSALIDRTGKIVRRTELDTEEILQVEVPVAGSAETGGESLKNSLFGEENDREKK